MTSASEPATVRAMSYAPILAAVFVLWPVMGVLGGQGYAPLLLLAALAAIVYARPQPPPRIYALLTLAFVVWAAVTEIWSPASKGLLSGGLLSGDLSIDTASIRIGLAALAGCFALPAAVAVAKTGNGQTSARIMLLAIAVQGLVVLITAFAADDLITLVYGDDPHRRVEGIQNLGRNANAFILVLPILGAYLWTRKARHWRAIAMGIAIVAIVAAILLDSQSAQLSVVTMVIGACIVGALPKTGFRWLLGSMAAYIALAPLVFGVIIRLLKTLGVMLPGSFQSRVWAWERVIEITMDKPLLGHGIAASKTWRETYADHPGWLARLPEHWTHYAVIPGHPHNMPLQIWAETGLVGALFAAWAVAALALRLPPPDAMRADVRLATGGFIGVMFALMSTSYSVWNEAFWASIILAACGICLLAARTRSSMA